MTDVYLQPRREAEFDRTYAAQPAGQQIGTVNLQDVGPTQQLPVGGDRAFDQQVEMAAFEKGRMQGEMEAIRRMEAEAPLKQDLALQQVNTTIARPDVLEINRLTWLQRLSWVMGEACMLGMVVLTIVWHQEYRDGYGWGYNGDQFNNYQHFNVGILTFALGLVFHTQAISNYRVLPINFSAAANGMWYILMQACAITCYIITLTCLIMTTPEAKFWHVANWCFILALAIYLGHAFYSMFRAATHKAVPVTYETFAEIDENLDAHSHAGAHRADRERRTIYTPAPVNVPRGRNLPAANANVGAQVPVAPANAPRWAENPNTHAEDYFLLARAKWANVGYWAMGATFLMHIAFLQVLRAAGRNTWAQGEAAVPIDETGTEAHVVSSLGVLTLAMLVFISYMAMPPRTTLVKNGILQERRPSISTTAPTHLGQNAV